MSRKHIGVIGDSQVEQYRYLFSALSQLFPVEFLQQRSQPDGALDAVLVLDGNLAAGLAAAAGGLPAYIVMEGAYPPDRTTGLEVRFGGSTMLDVSLRHQVMTERRLGLFSPLPLQSGDEVLAATGGAPLWVNRPSGRSACQLVSFAPPVLQQKELLSEHLNGVSFLRLLPLLNFLRQLAADPDSWQAPASRACFVLDDPSLHWPSYGFIDYQRLAAHALQHGYCAAIATIPLDAWGVHRQVAAAFQSCSPRLTLLVHGNNHTTCELLRQNNGASLLAIAAQAMCRMERLERNSGLAFHRIMEAPHGALAHEVFAHLLALGYDAALCTSGLVVRHNSHVAWPATFGMHLSEVLGGGLPVLPRIRMSPDWKNRVCLAAFLRQPIILVGHHQDAAHDMGLLAEVAQVVNSLAGVTWSDILGILRTNFLHQQHGDLLRVKLYSRKVRVPIPKAIRRVQVERPWLEQDRTECLVVTLNGERRLRETAGATSEIFFLGKAAVAEVASELASPLLSSRVAPPPTSPWALARKLAMELRDRMSPVLPFIDKLRRRPEMNGS